MLSLEKLRITQELALQYFEDPGEEITLLEDEKLNRKMVEVRLARVIKSLLQEDPERLLGILYRIDVPESGFHQAMAAEHPDQELATRVIDRLIQKAHSRIRYRETGEI